MRQRIQRLEKADRLWVLQEKLARLLHDRATDRMQKNPASWLSAETASAL